MTLLWPVSCTQCDDSWSWSWIWIRITISRKRLSDHTQRREKGQRRDRGDQHGGAFLGGSSLISPTSPNVISLGHPHSGLLRLFLLALTLVSISISILICQLFSPYPPLLPPPRTALFVLASLRCGIPRAAFNLIFMILRPALCASFAFCIQFVFVFAFVAVFVSNSYL